MRIDATRLSSLALAFLLAGVVSGTSSAGPIDSDFDGVSDEADNCPKSYNPLQENDDNDNWGDACDNCLGMDNTLGGVPVDQCDTDTDGYGNLCDGDYNQDNIVGVPDFNIFRTCFGSPGAPGFADCDCNCDGVVGVPDFNCFRAQFGVGPGPSGRDCAGDGSGNCQPAPALAH